MIFICQNLFKYKFSDVKTFVKAVFWDVGQSVCGSFICQICKILFPLFCKICVNFANCFFSIFLPDIFMLILAQYLCQDFKVFVGLKISIFGVVGYAGKRN